MERQKMLNILVPGLAVAAVILLIGVVLVAGDKGGSDGKAGGGGGSGEAAGSPPFPLDDPAYREVEGGVKVWDVSEGAGDPCPKGATVTIHYTGWTTDGKKFDSSKDRGQPATFPLADLVKGWQVGIPGMKPGGKRRLVIPYQMGYGEAGRPPSIPPKATLLFEIDLIAVK